MNRTRGRVLVWVPLCARSFSPSAGLLGSLPGLSSRAHARFKQCLAMALRRGRGPPTSLSNNGNTCAAIEMHAPSTLRNPTPPNPSQLPSLPFTAAIEGGGRLPRRPTSASARSTPSSRLYSSRSRTPFSPPFSPSLSLSLPLSLALLVFQTRGRQAREVKRHNVM